MSDPNEFRLGIIGGCLSHQTDIPHSLLFHRQLDRMLNEHEGIRLKVAITRHFDCDYRSRLNALLDESIVDGVLLHLRVVFTAKSVLLVNHMMDGKRYYMFHPFLFNRSETGWNRKFAATTKGQALFASRELQNPTDSDKDPFEHPTPSRKIFGFHLRPLNLAAGMLVGLDNWAIADEFEMFARFRESCAQRRIPFFILGPTPVTTYAGETRLWHKMNMEIKSRMSGMDAPFSLLDQLADESGKTLLRGDGLHLNENGHAYVARRLYDTMAHWIKETLRTNR